MRSSPIQLHINDETSELKTVILGTATDPGPQLGINARVAEAIENGTYPSEAGVEAAIAAFEAVLRDNGVEVIRPVNIKNVRQTFTRDIGFVVDDHFVVAGMREPSRKAEITGIAHVLSAIDKSNVVYPPEGVFIEGGDVVQLDDKIFVGVGRRTNKAAVDFLRSTFPAKQIYSFEMEHDTNDPHKSILHLDCAFQPVGKKWALIYEKGFKSSPQKLKDIFGQNLIPMSAEDMYWMAPNIFSLSPHKVVSCPTFTGLNDVLVSKGIDVLTIPYEKVAILGGLLRCSTLPLHRS